MQAQPQPSAPRSLIQTASLCGLMGVMGWSFQVGGNGAAAVGRPGWEGGAGGRCVSPRAWEDPRTG